MNKPIKPMSEACGRGLTSINYSLISKAINFYEDLGFQYLEVPWIVSDKAVNVTLPKERKGNRCKTGMLVGSAEQSFIQLMIENQIKPGCYVAASPCFRDDEVDLLHQETFFKVELIDLKFDDENPEMDSELVMAARSLKISGLQWMVDKALSFFTSIPGGESSKIIPLSENCFDIELNDIEIGSYGIRTFKNFHWVYGTGIAEPRFSIAQCNEFGYFKARNILNFL